MINNLIYFKQSKIKLTIIMKFILANLIAFLKLKLIQQSNNNKLIMKKIYVMM